MDTADTRDSNPEEGALWKRHISGGDAGARNELVERYLPIAQKIAAVLYASRLDNSIEFADYLQYARIGLLEAVDRYDPQREASFATFATYRVRGAILNGIEKSTEVSTQKAHRRRLERERLRSVKDALPATDDAFMRMVDLTLNFAIGHLLEESGAWRPREADRASDPYLSFELKRLGERIKTLLETLPERERTIVRFHYFEHREFTEIAEMLDISKGRVSQLHARALQLLRDRYQALERCDKQV